METGYKKDGTGETYVQVTLLLFVAKMQFSRPRATANKNESSLSNECPCRNLTHKREKMEKVLAKELGTRVRVSGFESLIFLFYCY